MFVVIGKFQRIVDDVSRIHIPENMVKFAENLDTVVVDTVVVEDDVINRCVVDLPILFTDGFLVARSAKS